MEIVEAFLQRDDLNLNSQDYEGNTPLHNAINWNKPKVVELLLGHEGVSREVENYYGKTAEEYAKALGRTEILKLF